MTIFVQYQRGSPEWVRRLFLHCIGRYEVRKSRREDWFKALVKCQQEILDLHPHASYSVYKRREIYYWLYIPKWMYEDRNNDHARFLDIGCAFGTLALFARKIFDCEVNCIDMGDHLSQELIEKYNFFYSISNIELDPFPWKGGFDAIIFTEVLEHLNFHPLYTLKKIYGLLNKKGSLYLSTPDASRWGRRTTYYSDLTEMPFPKKGSEVLDDHIYHYTINELSQVLDKAGFRVNRFAYSPGLYGNRHFNFVLSKS